MPLLWSSSFNVESFSICPIKKECSAGRRDNNVLLRDNVPGSQGRDNNYSSYRHIVTVAGPLCSPPQDVQLNIASVYKFNIFAVGHLLQYKLLIKTFTPFYKRPEPSDIDILSLLAPSTLRTKRFNKRLHESDTPWSDFI